MISNTKTGWKTFEKDNYSYKMNYPAECTPRWSYGNPNYFELSCRASTLQIKYGNIDAKIPVSSWMKKMKYVEDSSKNVVVDNEKAIVRELNSEFGVGYQYLVTHNNQVYEFNLSKSEAEYFDQILSTFKFID